MANYKDWYNEVVDNPQKLSEALVAFENEFLKGNELLTIEGNLIELIKYHSGYLAYYDTMHTQLQCLRDYYEGELNRIRAIALKEMLDNPPTNKAPNATQTNKLVDQDERVVEALSLYNDVSYMYKKFNAIMKGFESRGYSLGQLTELKKHGLEEARV